MKNFMKPIINAIKYWTNSRIEESKVELNEKISNSKADWNQNNPEADNYVKNRTHWEEESEVVFVPETTLKFTATGYDGFQKLNDFDFIIGETYIVTYDSVDYECIAYIATGPGTPSVGDGAIADAGNDGSNGEPFFITNFGGTVIGVNTVGTHTIKIVQKVTTVHPLDAKYLPDDASRQSDWNENDETSKAYVKNRPFYEDVEVLFDGESALNQYGQYYFDTPINLEDGKTYQLAINGIKYIAISYYDDSDSSQYCQFQDSNGTIAYLYPRCIYINNAANITCQLQVAAYNIQQLDSKYIPNEILQVQSNWNEDDPTSKSYILNKPEALKLESGELTMSITQNAWKDMIYADGKFIAISDEYIFTYDGKKWSHKKLPNYWNWTAMAYGNGIFIIVGQKYSYGTMPYLYSQDGINWVQKTMPITGYHIYDITYGNNKFVAVCGNGGNVLYSEDGVVWNVSNIPSAGYWSSITFGNHKFVTNAANSSDAAFSEDGITWTLTDIKEFCNGSVMYGGDKFIILNTNDVSYSYDGAVWEQAILPIKAEYGWDAAAYGNNKFIAFSSSTNIAIYSKDGINWTQIDLPITAEWEKIAFGNNKFIAMGNRLDTPLCSYNGINWKTYDLHIDQDNQDKTIDIKDIILDGYAEEILNGYATEEYVDNAMAEVNVDGVVKYDESQDLTDEQKTQARENISALGYNWHTIDNNLGVMFASLGSDFIPNWENGLNVKSTDTYYENALSEFVKNLYTLMRRTQYFDSFAKNVVNSGFRLIDAGVLLDDTPYFFACVANSNDINNPNKIAFVSVKHQSTRSRWQLTDTSAWNVLRTALINDDGTLYQQTLDYTDTSLTKNGLPADAKVTGEALASKADKTDIVQGDWSQNDETANDFIKDRTHYEYEVTKTLISTSGTYSGSWNWIKYGTADFANIWIEGNEVLVKWNDVEYPLTVRWDSAMGYDGVGNFSNYYPGAEDTGEPFAIYINGFGNDGNCGFIVAVSGEEDVEATWEISFNGNFVKKLDIKYLPDNVATTEDIQRVSDIAVKVHGKMEKSNPVGHGSFSLNRKGNSVVGEQSYAEGDFTVASGSYSHAEGKSTIANYKSQHSQGEYNIADEGPLDFGTVDGTHRGKYAHIVGNGASDNSRSNAHTLDWQGNAWYSGDVYVGSTSGKNKDEGSKKLATEEYVGNFFDGTIKYNEAQNLTAEEIEQARQNIHSAGVMTAGLEMRPFTVTAVEDYHNWTVEYGDPIVASEGAEVYGDYIYNVATGAWSRASGAGTQALGDFSDASGWLTQATAFCSIASGRQTTASGPYSHAEGHQTKALKNDSHAEGEGSIANGARAHAEGYFTQANSNQAHSEGMNTIASGVNSHAEGWATTASGANAVSSGKNTLASGAESFANGLNTIAEGAQQTVHGKFNIKDTVSSMIVGNGSADTARSNAFTLDGAGNAWFSGDVYIKSTSGVNKDEGSKKLATEEYVNTQISSLQETVTPTALILASPNGTKFTITVDNNGILTATEVID